MRRDFKLAYKYFYLAFENGHLLAIYYLAQMYAEGTGVFKSCQNAVEVSSCNHLLKIITISLQVIESTAVVMLSSYCPVSVGIGGRGEGSHPHTII